jgi:beta-lactamase superfamily II metal-dependent hydrolase
VGNFGGTRVLLASDLGKAGQNTVFTRHPELRADIVVAGLPNNGEPLATDWIEMIRPKLIVIADSEFPAARRASNGLLNRLRRTGATVLSTRQAGAVTLWMRDRAWRVQTARPLTATESEIP